jgi:branched-chain amino acid transport system permease protein
VLGGILYTYLDDRLVAIGSSSAVHGLPSVLRTPLEQPLFLLGIAFILIVVFLPGGIAGLAARGRPTGLRRLEEAVRTTPTVTEPQEEA